MVERPSRAAKREHGFAGLIDNLDAHALGSPVDQKILGQLLQLGQVPDRLAQGLLRGGELLFLALGQGLVDRLLFEGFVRLTLRLAVLVPFRYGAGDRDRQSDRRALIGQRPIGRHRGAAHDAARPAGLARQAGRAEVVGDALLLLVRGGVQ
jgi:hypothetical protein